jgi:SNF2 family DNA or RNA helicase
MSGHADDEDRGRIIINDAAAEGQGFIYVHPHIAGRIKKHQIEGVRFMWNQIVTLGDMQGCLLAHTMGLGKTLQSITLLVAIATAARSIDPTISYQIPKCLQVSRTLVLCPPGLLDNWEEELFERLTLRSSRARDSKLSRTGLMMGVSSFLGMKCSAS